MRKLNEQWIEIIDGQKHMVKEVSALSYGNCNGCFLFTVDGCGKVSDFAPCSSDTIIKDLGILNEEGCLPAPWDETFYPNIYEGLLTIYTSNRRVLVCCEDDDMSMFVNGKTRQEAIDRWNRRA